MNQTTLNKLTKVFSEPNEAIDPTLILSIGGMILQFVKACSSPDAAKEHIKRGGPVAFSHAMEVVRSNTELRGKYARKKAQELVQAGTELSEEELDDLVNDSKDSLPPPHARGIFQFPITVFAFILMFASSALAQPSGIFQIDVEQNRRLDIIEKRLDEISNKLSPAQVTSKALSPSVAEALKHAPAYMIINGVMTHTSDDHLIQHGWKPEQLVGLTPDQKDRLHGASHGTAATAQAQQVTATVSGNHVNLCNGRACRRLRRG